MVLTTVDPYFMTHDSKNWNAALPISVIFEAIKNIKNCYFANSKSRKSITYLRDEEIKRERDSSTIGLM